MKTSLSNACEQELVRHFIADDGVFPNNAKLPLVVARRILAPASHGADYEALFLSHGWVPAWRAGIFEFDHYHSTAHEVLGCFRGSARLCFGGAADIRIEIQAGDAVIIPAGVAHRCVEADAFVCVGAYPAGQTWDTCTGMQGERPGADARVAALGPWAQDPFPLT